MMERESNSSLSKLKWLHLWDLHDIGSLVTYQPATHWTALETKDESNDSRHKCLAAERQGPCSSRWNAAFNELRTPERCEAVESRRTSKKSRSKGTSFTFRSHFWRFQATPSPGSPTQQVNWANSARKPDPDKVNDWTLDSAAALAAFAVNRAPLTLKTWDHDFELAPAKGYFHPRQSRGDARLTLVPPQRRHNRSLSTQFCDSISQIWAFLDDKVNSKTHKRIYRMEVRLISSRSCTANNSKYAIDEETDSLTTEHIPRRCP